VTESGRGQTTRRGIFGAFENFFAVDYHEAREVLEAQLAELRRYKLRRAEKDCLLFVRPDFPDEPISRPQVQHWHQVVCKAAKITGFMFRDFRHCCATK
jgi:integrase